MKAFFKISGGGGTHYMLRINGEALTLKNQGGAPLALSWIAEHAAELEFSLADAGTHDEALAALKAYLYHGMTAEPWEPVKGKAPS